jgi:molybdate transport system substrate-binding protein
VIYSRAGASGIYFEKLIEKLDIAAPIRARATVIPAGLTAERLVSGEGDLAIQQISELLMIDGVDIVGPFPPELQSATGFTAAILNGAPRAAEAAALLQALTAPAARDAYKASGLELP